MKISELTTLMKQVLTKKYYSPEQADKMIEVYLYAELMGKDTQGILKLLGTEPAQEIQPKYDPKITKQTDLSVIIDGGGAAGPLPSQLATERVIELARQRGFGVVGLNNIFSSAGAIGFYASKIARQNLIGFVCANSPRGVAYPKGIEPLFGTNPMAFGFPTLSEPIVFDMAASAITWYGLVRARSLGQPLPEGVAIDSEGIPTIDPEVAMKGAILPFDKGYKGAGLAMVVELLAGALTGASFVFDEGDWGAYFMAINPDLLIGADVFKKNASELVEKVKRSKTKDGSALHIPGYDSFARMQEQLSRDEIKIDPTLITQLREQLEK